MRHLVASRRISHIIHWRVLMHPKQVRYQAAPRADTKHFKHIDQIRSTKAFLDFTHLYRASFRALGTDSSHENGLRNYSGRLICSANSAENSIEKQLRGRPWFRRPSPPSYSFVPDRIQEPGGSPHPHSTSRGRHGTSLAQNLQCKT